MSSENYAPWRKKVHEVIFEADTPNGKLFDVVLLIAIVLSLIVVMLDSVPAYREKYSYFFSAAEWSFTILFSIEYILRIISIKHSRNYIFSFFGVIDFLSILPTYLGLFIGGAQALMVLRTIRLLRVFRVLKLARFIGEARVLTNAMRASQTKITVFIVTVVILVTILGTVMYLVESRAGSGFVSIPASIYWAIVTLTTVGYGDIAPATVTGQFIASIIMIMGYGIIAVPTGIVTHELSNQKKYSTSTQSCTNCGRTGHEDDAEYCKYCGEKL